jgi:hypothetical protein
MQPHIAKIFSVNAPWRIAQIKLKAMVFLSGSVWLTDLTSPTDRAFKAPNDPSPLFDGNGPKHFALLLKRVGCNHNLYRGTNNSPKVPN